MNYSDVKYKKWSYSYREWDDHASIITDNGYCVAVRPKYADNADWKAIAEEICERHNEFKLFKI